MKVNIVTTWTDEKAVSLCASVTYKFAMHWFHLFLFFCGNGRTEEIELL